MQRTAPRQNVDRILLALAVSVYVVSASLPPAWLDRVGLVLCPFRRATGLPCPGCGMTRAFVALGHGDVAAAMRYNALGLPLFLFGLAWITLSIWNRGTDRTPGASRATGWAAVAGALVMAAYGLYRILVPAARPF